MARIIRITIVKKIYEMELKSVTGVKVVCLWSCRSERRSTDYPGPC